MRVSPSGEEAVAHPGSSSTQVAVIVPVYNKRPYLLECIESIVRQIRPADEIVVVDDESNDGSAELVSELPRHFPSAPIRTFFKQHSGVGDTRNYAISQAHADSIIAFDADDVMHEAFIELALEAAEATRADVIYSDAELFGIREFTWSPKVFDAAEMKYDNLVPSFALFKKSWWRAVGGYSIAMPFLEDWCFFLALANQGASFHKLNGSYFKYRQTADSLCNSFIIGNWAHCQALIRTVHPEVFTTGEISEALVCLETIPEGWQTTFEAQIKLTPQSPLNYMWLALAARHREDKSNFLHYANKAVTLGANGLWLQSSNLTSAQQPGDL